jgi:hypothetical protein
MKIYDFSAIETVYVVGDIQGEFDTLMSSLNKGFKEKMSDDDIHPKEAERRKKEEERKHLEMVRRMRNQGIRINRQIQFPTLAMPQDSFTIKADYASIKPKALSFYSDAIIISTGNNRIGFNSDAYYEKVFGKMNEILVKNNTTILFIRGNNDDPSFFREEKINFTNVKTIPDYSIIKTKHGNVLCVGGGLSIDRVWRKKQQDRLSSISSDKKKILYWKDEMPIFDDDKMKELSESGIKISGVVSHVAPTFAFPDIADSLDDWYTKDADLARDIENERLVMDNIYDVLRSTGNRPSFWYYGHYKIDNREHRANILFRAMPPLVLSQPFSELQQYLVRKEMEKGSKKKARGFSRFSPIKQMNDTNDMMDAMLAEVRGVGVPADVLAGGEPMIEPAGEWAPIEAFEDAGAL